MTEKINIGEEIRRELRRQGKTNEWLAEQIHVHPRTVQKIFLKRAIDTQQLLLISQALDVNFFEHYTSTLKTTPDTGTMPAQGVD
ncbi:MAG: helix-turn-helix transcriptional regulator [Bacteroidales bacterium]|nr:helix-turn-helix transcriptional regulator [Bacteroidales bacterium]